MASVVLYFIKFNKDHQKFAATFLKTLLDANVISESYMIGWYDKTVEIDKESELYSKRKRKHFNELIEPFINWLKEAETEHGVTASGPAKVEGSDDDDDQITEKPSDSKDKKMKMQ